MGDSAIDQDDACICEFADECGGTGVLECEGCGGDLCVCGCGGEVDCYGCDECLDANDDGPNDGEDF